MDNLKQSQRHKQFVATKIPSVDTSGFELPWEDCNKKLQHPNFEKMSIFQLVGWIEQNNFDDMLNAVVEVDSCIFDFNPFEFIKDEDKIEEQFVSYCIEKCKEICQKK